MSDETDTDPWRPRGRTFWAEFARQQGVRGGENALAIKFLAAKERGETNASAARSAGAGGAANSVRLGFPRATRLRGSRRP